jgi:hypothetical protein
MLCIACGAKMQGVTITTPGAATTLGTVVRKGRALN